MAAMGRVAAHAVHATRRTPLAPRNVHRSRTDPSLEAVPASRSTIASSTVTVV